MNQQFASLVHRFCAEPVLIAPTYLGVVEDLRGASSEMTPEERRKELALEIHAVYGVEANSGESKPFSFSGGMALIPIRGTLLNRYGYSDSSATGYSYLHKTVSAAMADPEVKGVLFDVNSYGGEAQGCFECADALHAFRGTKPMTAVVDANCYSAAYALASAADRIVVTPSGGAGSVGVVMMHVDSSKFFEQCGFVVSLIYAGKHKVDGHPFAALPDNVRESFQRRIDARYESFVGQVARNRGLDAKVVRGTEANIFSAQEAMQIGLIDAVMSAGAAFAEFRDSLTTQVFMGANMGDKTIVANTGTTGAIAPATGAPATGAPATGAPATGAPATGAPATGAPATSTATAVSAERARISAILTSEHAKDRTDLASYLALKTDLAAEMAVQVLTAAPKAAAAAKPNLLEKAMAVTENPEVGGGGDGEAETKSMKEARAILSAYHQATGLKLDGGK